MNEAKKNRKETEVFKWLEIHDPKSELIGIWLQADLMQSYAEHYHKQQLEKDSKEFTYEFDCTSLSKANQLVFRHFMNDGVKVKIFKTTKT